MEILGIGSRVDHPELGKGVVTNVTHLHYWVTFIDGGLETLPLDTEWDVIEGVQDEVDTVSFFEVERSLTAILRKWGGITEPVIMAEKWKGGSLELQPADPGLAGKTVPIDTFFHKITMVRDRLRVMEQKINANKALDEAEKADLQQYLTRIYGSLTTFNVLFANKSDHFVGERTGR